MVFLVSRRTVQAGRDVLEFTSDQFSLAGHQLIWKAWKQRGQPVRHAWHASADDLIAILSDGKESYDSRRLIIDSTPNRTKQIGLIEQAGPRAVPITRARIISFWDAGAAMAVS